MNAVKLLRPVFGGLRLADITPEAVEDYIQMQRQKELAYHAATSQSALLLPV